MSQSKLEYLRGFGNEFHSECKGFEGSIPEGLINPQKLKYNLFAEQLSGSAFTAPRHLNKRSWLYRQKPSVIHEPFIPIESSGFGIEGGRTNPNQTRWKPFEMDDEMSKKKINFVDGIQTIAFSDNASSGSIAIHIYLSNINDHNSSFVNNDGDFLIVPQEGSLNIQTEFGKLFVEPYEICVIQRGMKFTVTSPSLSYIKDQNVSFNNNIIRGYILEVRGNHFELPYLGPIGANCLANPRDFLTPVACMDSSIDRKFLIYCKFRNKLFRATQNRSPYDVAGWFGNYTPYKYNLNNFVTINSVSVDHPDPSIFTVLTCPMPGNVGTALADFVIFPPRWECAKDTFRPPYYHRNCMTEFMGLIKGKYQAKSTAFAPGGATLHQSMIPHGPDKECFTKCTEQDTSIPSRIADDTMAFMFETSLTLQVTTSKFFEQSVDKDYYKCWESI